MLRGKATRTVAAVLTGYAVNAVLVAATEQLLPKLLSMRGYLIADLITQCLYEVLAGYICSFVAERSIRHIAISVLIGVGWLVGSVSLITSWNSEPHGYGVALLCIWAPCVWIGYALERSVTDTQSPQP